uniref:Glycosyl transferase family 25 domain-containing protein n=1 Tax=viral metagenome TaxID=1070528 RepID=A0A6C0ESX4_9ZZZZ
MLFDLINVMYINLEERKDRRINVEKELHKIGIDNPERFNAIKLTNGALGCSMSHLKCLEIAKKNNFDYILICEDDIEFLDPELFLSQLKRFLDFNNRWDVVLIAGNNMIPYVPVNDTCIKIYNCQTTTGYIVKKTYYDTLIQNYKEGIGKLLKEPTNNNYKIDKYWLNLQKVDRWYLIIPLTIVQRDDYSDIEKKVTNFKNYMLNYNKAYKN